MTLEEAVSSRGTFNSGSGAIIADKRAEMCRWSPIALAVSISISAAIPAAGQSTVEQTLESWVGTTSVSFLPLFAGQALTGCTLEYNALVKDWSYRGGAFVRVSGSFGFMAAGGAIAPVLKVVVHDLDTATLEMLPNAPDTAFVVSGFETNAASIINRYKSDTPGAVFVVFQPDPTIDMLFEALFRGDINVHFARTAEGMTVAVPIDLSVEDTAEDGKKTHSSAAVDTMIECSSRLAEMADGE